LKWKFSTGGRIESSPAVGSRGTIYVGSMDGYLYAINPHGTLEWKIRIPFLGSTTSPTVWSDGTIYVGADQYIFSINPHGYVNWNLTTNSVGGTYDSPAVGFDGTIYIGVDDPELEAVYPNGTMRWVNNDCLCPVDPTVADDGTILDASGYTDTFYAINPDGSTKWNLTGACCSSPSIGPDGTVYVGSGIGFDGKGGLFAIQPDGVLSWNLKKSISSSASIGADGVVYVTGEDGNLYAVNPDGTIKWTLNGNFSFFSSSSPAIGSDGTIYVESNDGSLYAIGSAGSGDH